MAARRLVVWIILCSTAAFGQVRPQQLSNAKVAGISLQHAGLVQSSSDKLVRNIGSQDTVRVLALMVDFQTDADTQTTGAGHFQLNGTLWPNAIDPAPHDSAYFAYKLVFLSNYFRKVSNGKLNIKGEVLGRVVTLSNVMSKYSPPKDGSDDKPLATLVTESWRLADSLYPSLQFGKYDAFVVFHAGVGRDINVVSLLGYDPAPFDIPSITFNLSTLRNYLGDASFTGIAVNKSSYRITNTLLLPETESRIFTSGLSADTVQESINGLLANSFGSFLGLPDLFDTKTGLTGIGDFGLMDPAGNLSFYSGLFPPEPSAWEKVYLGWVTPITLSAGTSTISLPAVGLKTGRDTVYKIPITDREYFLIENRSRDPYQNGQRLTMRKGNSIFTRTFTTDSSGFDYADVSSISGSVIDVEDFDWALPGYAIQSDTLRGGGILIWHIDEDVIAHGLADNTVNADPAHRGVSLEEADGSQDIGRVYSQFSDAGAGTELGWPLDFWFAENTIKYVVGTDTLNLYKNVFDKDSNPNSRSYSGAMSLVSVRAFSKRSPRMTATVVIGDAQAKRIPAFSRRLWMKNAVTVPSVTSSTVLAGLDGKVLAFKTDGSSRTKDTTGLLFPKGGGFSLAATELSGSTVIAGSQDSALFILNAYSTNSDALVDSVGSLSVPLGDRITTPAMFADLSIVPSVVVGTSRGTVWSYSYTGTLLKKSVVSSSPISSLTQLSSPSLSKPAALFFTSGGRLYSEQNSVALGDSSLPWIAVGVPFPLGDLIVVAQLGGRRILGFSRDLSQKLLETTVVSGSITDLLSTDLDADGAKDIVFVTGDRIYALNRLGASLAGFPISAPLAKTFAGNLLVGDVNGNKAPEILVSLSTGDVMAYDRNGRAVNGFPVQCAPAGQTMLAAFPSAAGNIGIVGLTSSGVLQAFEIGQPYNSQYFAWSQFLRDARHSNEDLLAGPVNTLPTNYLPSDRVYNWPNPVRGSSTQIRYYTPEDASISIKIFDLVGMRIAELHGQSKAGLDGEVTWDVTGIQSGVYLARLEATGGSGSHVAVIKIAVVK
ncbi:MAG: T9SS type A sorting domain-containing protein [Ignavibacteriales bacterium]|nr:T9SS type A sorting domain-containing protein [Ignavibacteriales bacterium]